MTPSNQADRYFHQNLNKVGEQLRVKVGAFDDPRALCAAILNDADNQAKERRRSRFRGPSLVSALGLAAALGISVTLFFYLYNGPTVQASTVLTHLAHQVQGDDVLEVEIESVTVDEVTVSGHFQVSDQAIVGDVQAVIIDAGEPLPIEVDATIALSDSGGWILLRKLQIPDPDVQAILRAILPQGSQLLLILPPDLTREKLEINGELQLAKVRSVAGGEVAKFAQEVMRSQSAVGAQVATQSDGTVLVTIPLQDADSLRSLIEIAANAVGKDVKGEINMDDSDLDDLLGGTFRIVYDPKSQAVRSFSISDVGEMKGTVKVSLRGGAIDPDLLDTARVTTPTTRTLDIGAAAGMLQAFGLGESE